MLKIPSESVGSVQRSTAMTYAAVMKWSQGRLTASARELIACCVSMLIGALGFVIVTRGRDVLRPTNVAWLLEGDAAQHWLGWQFFRLAPLIQFPFGLNYLNGMNWSSSIVFSDSIPLLAFFFKPVESFLPADFQYFGLWILASMILMGFFSFKLVRLFVDSRFATVIFSAFFVFAPVELNQLFWYGALFGHWMIVAALFLYFSKKNKLGGWIALVVCAALVHAYLLVMVLGIWAANLAKSFLEDEANARSLLKSSTLVLGSCLLVMIAAGYFVHGSTASQKLLSGTYRADLITFVHPGPWSRIVPHFPVPGTEGFGYLGLGIILLGGLVLILGQWRGQNWQQISWKSTGPICVLAGGFFLYSLSSNVAAGGHVLMSVALPRFTDGITETFRVSGRFVWVPIYIIYLATIVGLWRMVSHGTAIALSCSLLMLQLIDSSPALEKLSKRFAVTTWNTPLKSEVWHDMPKLYRSIFHVLPENDSPDWMVWARYASTYGLGNNAGYLNRLDGDLYLSERAAATKEAVSRSLKHDRLYVFSDSRLFAASALLNSDPTTIYGRLDGFFIAAPGLRLCPDCKWSQVEEVKPDQFVDQFRYDGQILSLATGGNGSNYLLSGWSQTEDWGVWSDGPSASVLLADAALAGKGNVELVIEARGFVYQSQPKQRVRVRVNGADAGELLLDWDITSTSLQVPTEALRSSVLQIELVPETPMSPATIGTSSDKRLLGVGLKSLQLRYGTT